MVYGIMFIRSVSVGQVQIAWAGVLIVLWCSLLHSSLKPTGKRVGFDLKVKSKQWRSKQRPPWIIDSVRQRKYSWVAIYSLSFLAFVVGTSPWIPPGFSLCQRKVWQECGERAFNLVGLSTKCMLGWAVVRAFAIEADVVGCGKKEVKVTLPVNQMGPQARRAPYRPISPAANVICKIFECLPKHDNSVCRNWISS